MPICKPKSRQITTRKTEFRLSLLTEKKGSGSRANSGEVLRRYVLQMLLNDFLRADSRNRQRCFDRVQGFLKATHGPEYIDDVLKFFSQRGGSEGLQIGIDLLANLDDRMISFAKSALKKEVIGTENNHLPQYQPNIDYWYMIVRVIGKIHDKDYSFVFINSLSNSVYRGIVEGVLFALRDLGTEQAIRQIRRLAEQHEDLWVKELANEILDDFSEFVNTDNHTQKS